MHSLHPGAKLQRNKFAPGSKISHPHMPVNCVHTYLDFIRNLAQVTHFDKKFPVFECS